MSVRKRLLQLALQAIIATVLFLALALATQAQEEKIGQALSEMLAEAQEQVEFITVEELFDAIDAEHKMTLVDVRTEAEYEAGHLRGAVWIPRGKLEFVAAKETLGSTSDEIVVYCKHDGRSSLAAATLKRLGFEHVKYLQEGFELWVTSGHTIYNMHGEIAVVEYEKSEQQ